ncbi:MAG: TlpA disulfide reductase family protein [Flavobacteriaceae bacterium]
MLKSKIKKSNILFLIIIALLLVPQTRQPIQVFLHRVISFVNPVSVNKSSLVKIEDYNWELKNINGNVFNFKETKGKVVLINFWATWCPPCIAEMPSMQLLYADYKDKVEFIFVSNESETVINNFLNKNKYTFEVFNSKSEYPEYFNIKSIPRTFIIDKKGHIVIDKSGAVNWNSDSVRNTIDELLN